MKPGQQVGLKVHKAPVAFMGFTFKHFIRRVNFEEIILRISGRRALLKALTEKSLTETKKSLTEKIVNWKSLTEFEIINA